MRRVVDASVAMKWFVTEPHWQEARALLGTSVTLLAPSLIVVEVANAAWRWQRTGAVTRDDALAIASEIVNHIHLLVPVESLVARAAEIAAGLDHPVYDCTYLALAEREQTVVASDDRRLLNRVAATAFAPLLRPLVASP